jgi:hypothetical protein
MSVVLNALIVKILGLMIAPNMKSILETRGRHCVESIDEIFGEISIEVELLVPHLHIVRSLTTKRKATWIIHKLVSCSR